MSQEASLEPGPGILLIAHPLLPDPNFQRTVVLLCEHQDEEGSFGLVLNRVMPQPMNELLVNFEAFETPILHGGPVQTDTLHVLHAHGDRIDGAIRVVDGLWWGGDPDAIRELVEGRQLPIDDFRFFIGYSGWGVGQLADEIQEGTWILHRATDRHVLQVEPVRLWRSVLREMGGEYAVLANFPQDLRMN